MSELALVQDDHEDQEQPADPPPPPAPSGLLKAGELLWLRIVDEHVLDGRELTVLEAACRQADDVSRLERLVKRHGMVVDGSKGQPRLSQLVPEIRAGRDAVTKLLDRLALPAEEDERPMTGRQRRARRAARSRWDREGATGGA